MVENIFLNIFILTAAKNHISYYLLFGNGSYGHFMRNLRIKGCLVLASNSLIDAEIHFINWKNCSAKLQIVVKLSNLDIQHTTYNIQHTTYNIQYTTYNIQNKLTITHAIASVTVM